MKTLTATLACGLVMLAASAATARGIGQAGRPRASVHRAAGHVGRPTARPTARPTSTAMRSGQNRQAAYRGMGSTRPWASIGDIKGEMPGPKRFGIGGYRPWASIGDIKGETPQPWRRGGFRPWASIGDIKGEAPLP